MEIKTASQKLSSETAPITFPAETARMAPGSQRKSIQEDVLIYITDMPEKWAQGEHSFQHTKRQVKNSICTRRCITGERALLSERAHERDMRLE